MLLNMELSAELSLAEILAARGGPSSRNGETVKESKGVSMGGGRKLRCRGREACENLSCSFDLGLDLNFDLVVVSAVFEAAPEDFLNRLKHPYVSQDNIGTLGFARTGQSPGDRTSLDKVSIEAQRRNVLQSD
jgi:hypothetical protein